VPLDLQDMPDYSEMMKEYYRSKITEEDGRRRFRGLAALRAFNELKIFPKDLNREISEFVEERSTRELKEFYNLMVQFQSDSLTPLGAVVTENGMYVLRESGLFLMFPQAALEKYETAINMSMLQCTDGMGNGQARRILRAADMIEQIIKMAGAVKFTLEGKFYELEKKFDQPISLS